MKRGEALAAEFERACEAFADFAAGLTPEQWRATAVNHPEISMGRDEDRPVGVVAHHVAETIPVLAERVRLRAEGLDTPAVDFDAANARHAAVNAQPDQAETVALVLDNGAAAAELIRSLSDESLDRAGTGSPMTAEQAVRRVMIGHFAMHEGSIRAAVGAPAPEQR